MTSSDEIILRIRALPGQGPALRKELGRFVDSQMRILKSYSIEPSGYYTDAPSNDVAGNLLFTTTRTGD